jgi:protein-S-isoprenylcysteine O-methyltransferase Ste14
MPSPDRNLLLAVVAVSTLGFVALAANGAGGWGPFWSHPARGAVVLVMLAAAASAAFTEVNISAGVRTGGGNVGVILGMMVWGPFLAWLPPWLERHDVGVIDGDVLRWAGVVLFAAGCALRVWPVFILGRRFSALVAIQPGHELVTSGPYAVVRHPSYLGGLIALVGWVLVFRSAAGLLLLLPPWMGTVARVKAEEQLLAEEFGQAHAAYRRATPWRLVPGVY